MDLKKFDKELSTLAPSKRTAARTLYAAFLILKENGGQMSSGDIFQKIGESLDFTDWEKEIYEKSGYVRWVAILHFFSVDTSKAGFLIKKKGVWHLTEEGSKAISLGPVGLLEAANGKYKEWSNDQKRSGSTGSDKASTDLIPLIAENETQSRKALLQANEDKARQEIQDFIREKNPYEFQDLVAALLRGMGYYVSFNAPKGKDGGIDIIAHIDPLGATGPLLKVQVKHKPDTPISVGDIRSMVGLLNKDSDVGLFVTSGSFTSESNKFAREGHKHIRLIDSSAFIELWMSFYGKLSEEDKNLLPLKPIYYLGTNE